MEKSQYLYIFLIYSNINVHGCREQTNLATLQNTKDNQK